MVKKVIVLGGGAAGFFGAITCAQKYADVQVVLVEAGPEVLAKVRISGGGRCNVTHACFEPGLLVQNYPRGSKALRGAFTRFQPQDTIEWFASQGVELKTEADGRMFPTTDNSATITHCLEQAAIEAGVQIWTKSAAVRVSREEGQFLVELRRGEQLRGDRLLLATGSNPHGYKIAAALGHTLIPPVPSLFTFNINDPRLSELSGVSLEQVKLRLVPEEKNPHKTLTKTSSKTSHKTPLEQTGAFLITHWGVSGPAVLKLSAWAARVLHDQQYQAQLIINWLPAYNPEVLRQQLMAVKGQLPQRSIASSCPFPVPKRLWQKLVNYLGVSDGQKWAELSKKTLNQLVEELTQGTYAIQGKGVFKEEFVTCGGVPLAEVDFKTMESKICPGLYLAGEVLDIDGVTGGFNFQSAWTTGYLAGLGLGS
jgi:predicted Rossmann fold flavoprotein